MVKGGVGATVAEVTGGRGRVVARMNMVSGMITRCGKSWS